MNNFKLQVTRKITGNLKRFFLKNYFALPTSPEIIFASILPFGSSLEE